MSGGVSLMGDSVRSTTSVVGVVVGVVAGREVARARPTSIFGMIREAVLGSWIVGGLGIGTSTASAGTPTEAVGVDLLLLLNDGLIFSGMIPPHSVIKVIT